MHSSPSRCIIFIATGKRYLEEANLNASQSKSVCDSSISFVIYTDLVDQVDDSVFDYKFIIDEPSYSFRDKILPLVDSHFDQCLFLDSDATLIFSPNELFKLLEFSDLCCSAAPVRIPPGWCDSEVPRPFPEYNTGVILFNNTPNIKKFILQWLSLYDSIYQSCGQVWDQASFRSTLYKFMHYGLIKFFELPSECNLRTTKPWIAGRGLPVYVIHGRYKREEFFPFTEYLNSDIDKFRTFSHWCSINPNTTIRPRFDRTFN